MNTSDMTADMVAILDEAFHPTDGEGVLLNTADAMERADPFSI